MVSVNKYQILPAQVCVEEVEQTEEEQSFCQEAIASAYPPLVQSLLITTELKINCYIYTRLSFKNEIINVSFAN